MKARSLFGLMTAMLCYTNLVHADYIFHSNRSNVCEQISGQWSGNGHAYNWLIGTCKYHGSGTVSTPDAEGKFTITVTAYKDSGSFLCPSTSTKQLDAECIDGAATIHTEYGNLLGSFSDRKGSAEGTLSVAPGMKAQIAIAFQREE